MVEKCQKVLDGFGMPAQWALGIVVLIFKGKGDIRSCSCSRRFTAAAVKLLEHVMKVVERVMEKNPCRNSVC